MTSPGSFCLFMMERIWEAVRSVSTITWNSLQMSNAHTSCSTYVQSIYMYVYIYYVLVWWNGDLFPAVTSTAVDTRRSHVKFSMTGPYTPLNCFSSTILFTESSPLFNAYRYMYIHMYRYCMNTHICVHARICVYCTLYIHVYYIYLHLTFPTVARRFLSHLVSSSLQF